MSQVDYYMDENGEWRWRVTAENSRIIAASSEGFAGKFEAERNFRLVADAMQEHR